MSGYQRNTNGSPTPTPLTARLLWVLLCLGVASTFTHQAHARMVRPDPDVPYQHEYPEPYYDYANNLLRQHLPLWNTSAPIFHEFVDYALYSTTFSDDSYRPEPDQLRLRAGVGQRLWKPIGPQTPDQSWTTTQFNLEAGFYHSNLAWVQARSFLDLSWLVSGDPQNPSQEDTITQGSHRVRGQIGIGDVGDGPGLDLELDGQFDHMAPHTLRSRRPDILPLGHTDASLKARLWLRHGDDDKDGSFVMPVSYDLRQVSYTDPTTSPLGGFTSESFSTGIGMRPYTGNAAGWFEFVGLSWTRYAFDHTTDCAACPSVVTTTPNTLTQALEGPSTTGRLNQLEQIDLRVIHMDGVTLYEDDFIVSGHFFLGGSWMWDPSGTQQAALMTGAYGMSGRFEGGSAGFVASCRPGVAPDASRAMAVWRLEWLAEVFLEEAHMGGAFRATSAWLHDLDRNFDQQTMPSQHTIYTEIFFAPLTELQVGVFHNTGSTLAGDDSWTLAPMANQYGWQHHLGAFARFNIEPLDTF